jgi:GR25 family glycosyltransferase involved in LPS biosynthesis
MNSLLVGCPKFYYINLNRSKDRKEIIEKAFNEHNVPFERIEGIDGNKLDNWDKRLNNGEYGCIMSHFKAIEKFHNSGEDVGIICEDDMTFEFLPYWKKSIKQIIEDAPIDWEIIMFSHIMLPHNFVYLNKDYSNFNQYVHSSTLCYCINNKAAGKFIQKHNIQSPNIQNFNKNRPVADVFIYETLKTYVYKYCLFTYSDTNTSLIHNDHLTVHMNSKEAAKKKIMNS